MEVDDEDPLAKKLNYDGIYGLAVCMDCSYALPLEWIEKHFKEVHKLSVVSLCFGKGLLS